jgi:translation elongation factor EF-1alpha
VDAIDQFKSRKNPVNKPIRVCVYDYYNKGQDAFSAVQGDCISCKIESGVIQEKDKLILKPLDEMVTIKAIEKNKEKCQNAFSGEMCEI